MVITAKSLADGQLQNGGSTLYTVPAATKTVIKTIRLVNIDESDKNFTISITRQGSSARLITPNNMTLNAGYMCEVVDDEVILLSEGDTINGDVTESNTIDYIITGVEEA